MARPKKKRNICSLPNKNKFGPLDIEKNKRDVLNMTIDEYETIRLIDYEGLTQEECSIQMDIARATVQRIYSSARKKLSKLLVSGKVLLIDGGHYTICDGTSKYCNMKMCRRRKNICDKGGRYSENSNSSKETK